MRETGPVGAWMATLCLGCAGASAPPPGVADGAGCTLERVTAALDGEAHFQFHGPARDGRALLVGWARGDEARGAYLLDVETNARRDLDGIDNAGVIAPDGRTALVATTMPDGRPDVVEIDLATGAATPIAPHPQSDFLATYSSDGRSILFNSYRTGASDLYLVDRAGGEPQRLTDFDGYEAHADFSPDGTTILFHRQVADNDYDVYRLDAKTLSATPFIAGPGEQSYPSWSPDGRFVAYASDEGNAPGATDVYVADRSGARVSRVTATPGYNAYPAWSADGRWLYLNAEREGRRDVFRVSMAADGHCTR